MRARTRRAALRSIAIVATAGVAGCTSFASSDDRIRSDRADERIDGTWPMHHATPENTRAASARGPVAEPAVEWTRPVGSITSMDPIAAESLVYATDPETGALIALEVATGERTTASDLDGERAVVAGVDGGRALLLRGDDSEQSIAARALDTGEALWSATPSPHPGASVFDDGTAYVTGSTEPGSGNGWIHALELEDGTNHWSFEAVDHPDSVAVGGGRVAFHVGDHLFSLDADTGERLWNVRLDDRITAGPLLFDGEIVVGTAAGEVLALDTSGDVRWASHVSEAVVVALTRVDDRLVAAADAELSVLEPSAETRVNSAELPVESIGQLTTDGERLYVVGGAATELTAIALEDLTEAWSVSLSNTIHPGMAVLEGTLLVWIGPRGPDADHGEADELVALR